MWDLRLQQRREGGKRLYDCDRTSDGMQRLLIPKCIYESSPEVTWNRWPLVTATLALPQNGCLDLFEVCRLHRLLSFH
jgi:hypothetical protein